MLTCRAVNGIHLLKMNESLRSRSADQYRKRIARIAARARARSGDGHSRSIRNHTARIDRHRYPATERSILGNGRDDLIDAGTTRRAAGVLTLRQFVAGPLTKTTIPCPTQP